MPHQEVMVNTMRFAQPPQGVDGHVFFNPFSDHNSVQPAPNSYTSAAWDSWPAPNVNVIHIAPPPSVPTLSSPGVVHSVSFANIGQALNGFTHNNIIPPNSNAINSYDVEYGLGLADPSSEEIMNLYSSVPSNPPLPVELQYCFDHLQQPGGGLGAISLSDVYNPLSAENSGMNVNVNMNASLLNLDIPGFCPLDL